VFVLVLVFVCGFALALGAAGCAERPAGLRATPPGTGPQVVHDLEARPFPDVPFPNDLGTRLDPSSPTGRRINVGTTGETRMEREVREKLNTLDGFGTFAPITVRFDAPLDLDNLIARHRDNLEFADDAVFLVNIDPGSPDYGRPVRLDMGRGNYPATQRPDTEYHPADPRQGAVTLLYETVDEDENGNGQLDPGEDTDGDGVLDRPNVWPPGARPEDGLLTWYERETDTLILRPVVPLREQSEYAVVLTERLVGADGEPVRSPFPFVHHLSQTERLRRLESVFATWRRESIDPVDLSLQDVAFAWVFTTQSVTGDLRALREGLHGAGPFRRLASRFPAEVTPEPALNDDTDPERYTLDISYFNILAENVLGPAFDIDATQVGALLADLEHVDYVVQGRYPSPDLLTQDLPYRWDWTMDLDRQTGKARVRDAELHFTLVVPRTTADHGPPFPVAVYAHGFGQARIEFVGFAGILARYGIASVGIDAWGHGIYLPEAERGLFLDMTDVLGFRPFGETLLQGRAESLDGDDKIDAGGDMFSAYAFHSRDTVRQTVVDLLQLVRVLQGFDGERTWGLDLDEDGRPDLAGDWNGDGTVDAGGAVDYFMWGSSLGGILTQITGALEPAIIACAPVAGGGALTHLTTRSQQISVRSDTVGRATGPVIYGVPAEDATGAGPDPAPDAAPDTIRVTYFFPLAKRFRHLPIAEVSGVRPGDVVRVTNLDKDRAAEVALSDDLSFALHMKADWGDRFTVTLRDPGGAEIAHLDTWSEDVWYARGEAPTYRAGEPLRSPGEGWGLQRGAPDLRRLIGVAQTVLESGDPINYARHFLTEPLHLRPEGPAPTNVLLLLTLGDNMNPMDIHGAWARAAGLVEVAQPDPRYGKSVNDWLIDNWVYEGICGFGRFPPNAHGEEVLFDPDRLDDLCRDATELDGNGFDAPGPPPGDELRLTLDTATGRSGIRFGHMQPCGKHSFFITNPANRFNVDEYLAAVAGYYFATRGQVILDDPCLEDNSCPLP
jgi:hypothetical protein